MRYYSIHFNRPDFIEIQYNLSKKIGYDITFVNNGANADIKKICQELELDYIEVDDYKTTPSHSHGNAINKILSKINFDEDWGLLDHDMFITTKIDFSECDIVTHKCKSVDNIFYFWPGMLMCKGGVDFSDVNFLPGVGLLNGDTGGDTYRKVSQYVVKWCDIEYQGERNKNLIQDSKIITSHIIDGEVIGYHYLNGSNWTGGDDRFHKNEMLKSIIGL